MPDDCHGVAPSNAKLRNWLASTGQSQSCWNAGTPGTNATFHIVEQTTKLRPSNTTSRMILKRQGIRDLLRDSPYVLEKRAYHHRTMPALTCRRVAIPLDSS